MVSISETCTVQKKTSILPFFTRFGIGRTTTIKKSIRSKEEVCLRRKTVSFEFSDNDKLGNMPTRYKVEGENKSNLELGAADECKDFEKSNNVERISSILKSSSITYNSHDLWVKEENRSVRYSKRGEFKDKKINQNLGCNEYTSSTCSSASESTTVPFKRSTSFRRSFNHLFRKNRISRVGMEPMTDAAPDPPKDKIVIIEKRNSVIDVPEKVIFVTKDVNKKGHPENVILVTKDVNKKGHRRAHSEKLNLVTNDASLEVKNDEKCHRRAHSYSGSTATTTANTKGSTNSVGLGYRPLSSSATPLESIQQDLLHGQSAFDLNALSLSPSHSSSKIDQKSLRQLSQSAPVAAATARSPSPHPPKPSKNDTTEKTEKPEKEKKKKELSSSRQKKFSRHFQQVALDEKVLNYFSCALVADILLQGHLYITQNYFAFYSNVFGYVTKILIPTVSVIKISKEKTAKIIPNAVGVMTCDDRHVFGSFMSREAAYRLMLSVWRPVAPIEEPITIKIPDVEISECSIEEDSSCSISGNESSSQVKDKKSDLVESGDSVEKVIVPCVTDSAKLLFDVCFSISESTVKHSINHIKKDLLLNPSKLTSATIIKTSSPSTTSQSSSSIYNKDKINGRNSGIQSISPSDFRVVHLGVFLAVILAFFSCFLMYKINYLQESRNSFHPNDFRWGADKNMDVYAEVLKWQKQMQAKSTEEAQIVLNSNLEQIAKVRKSLETLSILLHDSSMKYAADASTGDSNLEKSLDDSNYYEGAT